jgi:hypothetical protein
MELLKKRNLSPSRTLLKIDEILRSSPPIYKHTPALSRARVEPDVGLSR